MKTIKKISAATLLITGALAASWQSSHAEPLPFDPAKISRLSVDGIPRSIAIRQGADIWFGYDLEKAIVFKVWQAPKNKPGVILSNFKTQIEGTVLFDQTSEEGWQLESKGEQTPLSIRYLGCTESQDYYELRWELAHSTGKLQLTERIPTNPPTDSSQPSREIRIELLEQGSSLILPSSYREEWILESPEGEAAKSVIGSKWHVLSLK